MTERIFDIRLSTIYEGTDNKITSLDAGILHEGEWRTLTIDTLSAGFLLLCYGLGSCQHLYFRTNAAERDLVLASSNGRIHVVADEGWHIQKIEVQFEGVLRDGDPAQSDIDYIIDRMAHCPVSTNLVKPADSSTIVTFLETS